MLSNLGMIQKVENVFLFEVDFGKWFSMWVKT